MSYTNGNNAEQFWLDSTFQVTIHSSLYLYYTHTNISVCVCITRWTPDVSIAFSILYNVINTLSDNFTLYHLHYIYLPVSVERPTLNSHHRYLIQYSGQRDSVPDSSPKRLLNILIHLCTILREVVPKAAEVINYYIQKNFYIITVLQLKFVTVE